MTTSEPAPDRSVTTRRFGTAVVILCVLTVLAAVSWVLVFRPVSMGSDPLEIVDGAPSSAAAATFYVSLAAAIVLTATAALGWWWRTRNKAILVLLWLTLGVVLFGAAAVVIFVLPFL